MTTATLGIGTVNIGPDDLTEGHVHITAMFTLGADLVIANEMGSRDKLIAKLRSDFYNVVYSTAPNQGRVAVIGTQRFRVEKVEYVKVNDKRKVGEPGAGPKVAPDRWMPCVRVYDLVTRRRYWILGKHMIASQYIDVRDQEAEEDIRRTVAWINRHRLLAMFLAGDLNNVPTHPNFGPLRALLTNVGTYFGKYLPTHGSRHIDHVWYRTKRWLTPFSQRVVPVNPKDHDGYIATFQVKVRPVVVAALARVVRL